MKRTQLPGRRAFLRGAGGIAMSLPFLETFAGTARADAAGTPRFVTMLHPQGTILDLWLPTSTGSDFVMPEVLAPLAPVQEQVNILSGIDNGVTPLIGGAAHGVSSRTLLTSQPKVENVDGNELVTAYGSNGPAAGPSIDQVLAQRFGPAPYTSVDLAMGGGTSTGAHYAGSADPVSFEPSPHAAFDRLFSAFDPEAPSSLTQLRAARASVLDAVSESFTRVSQQVSAADRQRLDAHAEKIRELENSLVNLPGECALPMLDIAEDYDHSNADFDDVTSSAMIEVAAMALSCGLTNVASLAFTAGHTPRFPWLGLDVPGDWGLWHEMVHGARETAAGRPIMVEVFQWYARQFTRLVERLATFDEGEGTLLDNTLVLWVSEFGDGGRHRSSDLPVVVAGGACGAVRTGRHIACDGHTNGDVMLSILHAFGEDDVSFGWPGTGEQPIADFG